MFGQLFGRRFANQVLDKAVLSLGSYAPHAQLEVEEKRILVQLEGKRAVWNLHDFIRTEKNSEQWAADIDELARQVAVNLSQAGATQAEARIDLALRLRPSERLPELSEDMAVEKVWPGVHLLYGHETGDGLTVATWAEVDAIGSREEVRTQAALGMLDPNLKMGDLVTPMAQGLPVYTNGAFIPHAAALFMAPGFWKALAAEMEPASETLLGLAPAPSRIFVTPVDAPQMVDTLRKIGERAAQMEEELLSLSVLRFDGERWAPIDD